MSPPSATLKRKGRTRSKSRSPSRPKARAPARPDAEALARKQREISVSEFFAKNRHLLGFDNPRKALLTTVKEAVDNALDACEEAGILPELYIRIHPISETRFLVTVRDNGPGIVRGQVENIFGKLLYGSKFHRLKMSRGQQGIGIAAAGMYGLMSTGKPMVIHTKPKKNRPCHRVVLAIDTQKNKAEVTDEEERHDFEHTTGTEVNIELEGRYNRGRQSVDEYLEQTAIANPHVQFIYQPPTACQADESDNGAVKDMPSLIDDLKHAQRIAGRIEATTATPGGTVVYPRTVDHLPDDPREIKPHPRGIELGTLIKMLKATEHKKVSAFLKSEFCRVTPKVVKQLLSKSGLTDKTWVRGTTHAEAERLYKAIQDTRFMAPPTDCLAPIGAKQILAGLLKGVKAEFFTATTRDPAVYRGNPFQIEVGMAYGGDLAADELGRVIRFANRVPLLYQQSACCAYKSVIETTWRNYGLTQSRSALPQGPLIVMIHLASVWVPFTSESKEAVANYDEIRKEIKLALGECGRKLKTYLGRRQRMRREGERRGVFDRYIGEVVGAMTTIDPKLSQRTLRSHFQAVSRMVTEDADMQFDADGNPIRAPRGAKPAKGATGFERDEDTVIIEPGSPLPQTKSSAKRSRKKKTGRKNYSQAELF